MHTDISRHIKQEILFNYWGFRHKFNVSRIRRFPCRTGSGFNMIYIWVKMKRVKATNS